MRHAIGGRKICACDYLINLDDIVRRHHRVSIYIYIYIACVCKI